MTEDDSFAKVYFYARYAMGTVPSSSLRPFASLRGRSNRPHGSANPLITCSVSKNSEYFETTNRSLILTTDY